MPWTENKRVKITVLRETVNAQNTVVEFEIDEARRVKFQTALEYLLAAVINVGGEIKSISEVVDSETKEDVTIEIQLLGFQKTIIDVINQHIGSLKSASLRSR